MRLTGEGHSVGTPDYMSPEQAQGREVDARTDLWSLGVVLFELLTGALPFRREHRGALVHAILTDPIPDMPGVPGELRQIVVKALAKDPAERWQSAHAMARALKGEPEPVSADDQPTQTVISAVPPPERKLWPAIVVGAVVLLALAGFGFYRWRMKAPGLPMQKHIAMLPKATENVSAIENGVDDALTAALSGQPNVTLVTSSELRRGSIKTVEAARKYHGANLTLTWSARPDGDKVEFTIDLVDAIRGGTLAQRKLVYDPKSPIVSRDQAVSQVFRMLDLPSPPVAARAPDPAAPEAFSAYLEGRGYLARYDLGTNIDKAIASFTKSTTQDPSYAMAFAGLAEAYWRKALSTTDKKWMNLAVQNAEHAVSLDPGLAMAHTILGSIYRDDGKRTEAVGEFQRALELAPKNAEAGRQLAGLYSMLGRFDEAEKLYIRSTDARPTDWSGYFQLGLFYSGRQRFEEAVAALNRAKTLASDNDLVRYNLGAVYRASGQYDEAIIEIQQALTIRSNPLFYAALGGVRFYQHRFSEAVSAVETAIELSPDQYWLWGNLGIYAKWAPGNEAKSDPALHRAVELAGKAADVEQTNYSIRANLAEYRARLGDAKGAAAELERIPESARAPLTTRFAIVYELTGQRGKAIATIREKMKNPATLNQIRDDPDLAAVWRALR
jgi:serine/threonine-protein kinase